MKVLWPILGALVILGIIFVSLSENDPVTVESPTTESTETVIVDETVYTGILANLTISHPPKLGEEAQLTLRIEAPVLREDQSIKNMSAEVILPEGFAFVNGDLFWSGELHASETVELTSTIRAVDVGEWAIQGKTKGAIDFLYIYVSENDAFLNEKPFPITKQPTTFQPRVKLNQSNDT